MSGYQTRRCHVRRMMEAELSSDSFEPTNGDVLRHVCAHLGDIYGRVGEVIRQLYPPDIILALEVAGLDQTALYQFAVVGKTGYLIEKGEEIDSL